MCVPASLLDNWAREINNWCPKLRIVTYHGNSREATRMRLEAWRVRVAEALDSGELAEPPSGYIRPGDEAAAMAAGKASRRGGGGYEDSDEEDYDDGDDSSDQSASEGERTPRDRAKRARKRAPARPPGCPGPPLRRRPLELVTPCPVQPPACPAAPLLPPKRGAQPSALSRPFPAPAPKRPSPAPAPDRRRRRRPAEEPDGVALDTRTNEVLDEDEAGVTSGRGAFDVMLTTYSLFERESQRHT